MVFHVLLLLLAGYHLHVLGLRRDQFAVVPRLSLELPIVVYGNNSVVVDIKEMATNVINVNVLIELSLNLLKLDGKS